MNITRFQLDSFYGGNKKEEKENFVHSFLKKESCLEVYNVPQIRVLLEGQEF